jgi:UDP-N-acetylmuramoyl-tripeptide--D-alanyl-D-alanine ligase
MSLPTTGWLNVLFHANAALQEAHPLRIGIDSRKIALGDVFWALKGTRDGHEFVETAFDNGAIAAVVNRDYACNNRFNDRLLRVDDTLAALTFAARVWRKEFTCLVIGITGSVGKTTAKDYVRAAFAQSRKVNATEGNFNNEIGVPLTLLGTPSDTEVLICEMGAARVGDIEHLCSVANPQWGLVTAIADAHFESFGSRENVARTKRELYEHVAGHGIAFVPITDERCVQASLECRTRVGFGFENPSAYWESGYVQGEGLVFDELAQASFRVQGEDIKLSVPGRPAAQAALAAMSIATFHGVVPSDAALGVSRAVPTKGRATVRKFGHVTVIDDSYNASPTSMRSALETLSLRQGTRKVVVLGDMLELGEISDVSHREVVSDLDRAGVSLAILVGPRFSSVAASSFTRARLLIYPSVEDALPNLLKLVRPDDLVLVKASRGMALDKVVSKLEEVFS